MLNQRELTGEEMVAKIMDHVERRLPPDMSADEKRQALFRGIMDKLNELSASLQIRLGPIAKSLMMFRQNRDMNELFAEVQLPELSLKEKSLLYGRMLFKLLDDPDYVSYTTTNPKLLGNLPPKDVWFLTFLPLSLANGPRETICSSWAVRASPARERASSLNRSS